MTQYLYKVTSVSVWKKLIKTQIPFVSRCRQNGSHTNRVCLLSPRNTSPPLSIVRELSRNPRKRRKSWTIVVRIGDVSWRDTSEEGERIGSGKRGRRGRGEGGLVEGGIYEIVGHPPTAATVNSGDRWAVALMYIRVRGWKSRSLGYIDNASRARVCRAQDTPDFGAARG